MVHYYSYTLHGLERYFTALTIPNTPTMLGGVTSAWTKIISGGQTGQTMRR